LKKPSISETCFTCHQQQRAEFNRKSHMPLPEGKISCEDCHNPHGTSSQRLIKANSVNNLCYTCHAEKRGPFIWEHAPVRENCLNCHLQHGSTNDKLLKLSRPFLCMSCHNMADAMGHQLRNVGQNAAGTAASDERMRGRSCQNCHSQIHGSNSPDGARFRR
jgi:DmsE family decaheme c-type cytochrome